MQPIVQVSSHPLVLHKLTCLRDRTTEPPTFRRLVGELACLLFYEASHDLPLRPVTVETPLASCPGHELAASVGLVPILRAGLGMAEALLELLPTARVWHLGLYRDHETLLPITYYNKLPPRPNVDCALVLDPMLATGGSARAALDLLAGWGVARIKYLALIAAPEGVRALHAVHPNVPVYLGALDSHLNDQAYIVPGLGDAGDRQFATG
jgi:uracil phosphoribosyltransferase